MINPMDLSGKHILVAGASSGIGAETARQITRLGGKVSLLARREDKLQEVVASLEEQRGKYYVLDFANAEDIAGVIERIYQEQGTFDGAVYSVGEGENRPLKMTKPQRLKEVAAVNFFGYVEFVRCITMKKFREEKMSIVGISSIASKQGEKGKTMYCSTKAAMNGAMRALAHELADVNVRVNNVLPGWVRTAMYNDYIKNLGDEIVNKELAVYQYMGEPLETVDVANAVCFLLSDAARFITGTEMVVAGGYLS